jgi:tRNA A37 threonylcarbamoyltransferase TsaD
VILGEELSSQQNAHKDYGGVYPPVARREHEKNIDSVLMQALKGIKNDFTHLR